MYAQFLSPSFPQSDQLFVEKKGASQGHPLISPSCSQQASLKGVQTGNDRSIGHLPFVVFARSLSCFDCRCPRPVRSSFDCRRFCRGTFLALVPRPPPRPPSMPGTDRSLCWVPSVCSVAHVPTPGEFGPSAAVALLVRWLPGTSSSAIPPSSSA